jgi:hypothetical protein
MSSLLDRVPDHTRPALKSIIRDIKLAESRRGIGFAGTRPGRIRWGGLAERGNAETYYPGIYFAWDTDKWTMFVTVPTTSSGGFDWTAITELAF